MASHDEYQQEIMCNCKTCGTPITRYFYVGYPFCDDCRKEYGRKKNQKRIDKLPFPKATEDYKCPDGRQERYYDHQHFYCTKYGKGRMYCETVRQKGKCPMMECD